MNDIKGNQFFDSRERVLGTFMHLQDKKRITSARCMSLYAAIGDLDRISFGIVMCAFAREYVRLMLTSRRDAQC